MANSKFEQFPERELRLILIGKTGAGKSSAANTILGQELCGVARGMSSGTEQCDMKTATRNGIRIKVTDTPGVCDTHRKLEEVHREICKSVATAVPGPHAVVMCLRCDRRFTDEEYQAYTQLKNLFGENLKKHMILLFSGLDQGGMPDFDKEGRKVPKFKQVLDDLDGKDERRLVFNNEADWEDRAKQGKKLLDAAAGIFRDNGQKYFSDDIMVKFEQAIQKKMQEENKTREEVQRDVINNNESVNDAIQQALPKKDVAKWKCTIL